ncbi:putative ribonuclease H-like domain-containing protein [Tanacetum coccineum]
MAFSDSEYDDLHAKLHEFVFKAATYKRGLATVEAQLVTYRKNEVLFSEEVDVLKREVGCKQYKINMLKTEFEKVKQEKDGIVFKIEKFDKASKDLDQLLESHITDKSKKGLGYSAVPPPHPLIYNRPNKLDLSYSGLNELKEPKFKGYGPENSKKESNVGCEKESDNSKENFDKSLIKEQESQVKSSFVEGCGSNTSKSVSEIEPKEVRKNNDAPIIEELVSDDEEQDESKTKPEKKTVIPTAAKIEKPVKKSIRPRIVNTARSYRTPVNTVRPRVINTARQNRTSVNAARANGFNAGKPQHDDKGFINNGCSRHMTGNIAYLSNFKQFDGGYVAFGGGAYGGKILGKGTLKTANLDFEDVYFVNELKFNLFSVSQMCDKKNYVLFTNTECLVLSPNFKLPDENQILLKVPRKDNMYSFDMKNIVPKESLTCLVAKATLDESMLWHRRLGHINFKNINKLVKDNLVRGLPIKRFENDQTCVACLKGKQHRASCKSKVLNPITKPLFMLHMDLFGPTFVSSLMNKKYCLVVTDDYSRFTWVFFLTTKDETSEILKRFIKEIENLVDKKVKIIRSDNGTEFKNKVMDDFCREKGIKREYSVARTPQQNGVAERRNRTLIKAARTMLADSKLPTTFWAEAVSTACYVQNRVLVVKPHNKTPYELFRGASEVYNQECIQDEDGLNNENAEQERFSDDSSSKDVNIKPTSIAKALSDSSWVETEIGYRHFQSKIALTNKRFTHKVNTAKAKTVKTARPNSEVVNVVRVNQENGKPQQDEHGLMLMILSMRLYKSSGSVKFNYIDVKSASTLVDLEKPLVKDGDVDDVDVHLYRYMISSLMYLIAFRPDIMFAVCACVRFQVTLKTSHLLAVKRIFRYLKGKPTLRLWYSRDSPFKLVAYIDSDYARATQDRKSTTGGC